LTKEASINTSKLRELMFNNIKVSPFVVLSIYY